MKAVTARIRGRTSAEEARRAPKHMRTKNTAQTIFLKCIFQRELEYSRISHSRDFPKQRIVQDCRRIVGVHMIRKIERLTANFDGMIFINLKRSRESHVDANTARTDNVVHSHIPELAVERLRESRTVDPLIDGLLFRIRIRQNLIRAVAAERIRQRRIDAGSNRKVTSRQDSYDARHPPAARQRAQRIAASETRRLVHRRHTEIVTSILIAVSAIVTPHTRIFVLSRNAELRFLQITDAVRQRVVPLNC